MPVPQQIAFSSSQSDSRLEFGLFGHANKNADSQPRLMVARGATTWHIATRRLDEFLTESGWRLSEWLASGQATRIKGGPHRDVYRLVLPSGCYYLKHFKMNDLRAWSRNLLRDCKATLEEQSACRLRQAAIPTYQTVAYGWRKQNGLVGESYLISREVPNALPLDELILQLREQAGNNYRIRAELAWMLGRLMGRLHRCKLLHGDLHTGNFLLQHAEEFLPSGQSAMQLWLIDPYPVIEQQHLTTRQRAANLSLLNNCFFKCTTPIERFRFFKAYFSEWEQNNNSPTETLHQQARFIEQFCKADYKKSLLRSDRKWQRPHSRLIVADKGRMRCRAVAELGQLQTLQLRDEAAQTFTRSCWQPGEQQLTIRLTRNQQPKKCLQLFWREKRPWFGKTTALQTWNDGLSLYRRGFPIVRPLFFCETSTRQTVIVQQLADVLPAAKFMQQELQQYHKEEQRSWQRRYEERFRYLKRKLQENGFVFRNRHQCWQQLLVSCDFNLTRLAIGDPSLLTHLK